MSSLPASSRSRHVARIGGRIALALLLLACIGFEGVKHAAYAWIAIGLVVPELTRLTGRHWYGAHSYWPALALLVVALPDPVPLAVFIVGLAWTARIATERAFGLQPAARGGARHAS